MTSASITISEIQFYPVKPQDGLLGFVSFVLDGKFWMGSVAVFTRRDGGYRLVYPTRKVAGQNINVFHPINPDVGLQVEQAVSEKVAEICSEQYGSIEPENTW
jgi:DNA-binding cell septation regulator SpoVG